MFKTTPWTGYSLKHTPNRYRAMCPVLTPIVSPQAFTCQCTPCRKNTGSLVAHFLGVPAAQITWASPPESGSSYREYASSAGCFRGFCETCGTTLTWRSERDPGTIELLLGTVDAGEGLVKELCVPAAGQFWCSNFVAGVTDGLVGGERWVENRGEGGVRLGESR